MKTVLFLFISAISLTHNWDCKGKMEQSLTQNEVETEANQITIKVGLKTFKATLNESSTTKAFKALLPLSIHMNELNKNEKYYDLPNSLPTSALVGGEIKMGDVMLYGSNTLVLFYKNFKTSYPYTKLGNIYNPAGLAAALGDGNVIVKFHNN